MASCGVSKNPWRTLSIPEAETATAVCDRFIPPETLPGAGWAGAADYIDRALTGHWKKLREAYRRGLAGVEQSAQDMFSAPFPKLKPEQQDQVLKAIEKGAAPGEIWKQDSPQQFFAMILSHTMQSYYGDPRHGGNRDEVGWQSIGYDATVIRGREQHDLGKPPAQGGRS